MEMKFKGLEFKLDDEHIYLTNLLDFGKRNDNDDITLFKFVECQIAGENHAFHCGAKQLNCSESKRLVYNSFAVNDNMLEIITKSPLNFTIVSSFKTYDDTKVIRTWNNIYNDTTRDIIIENLSSFRFAGFGENGTKSLDEINVYVFRNSWHCECQVEKVNLKEACFYNGNDSQSMKRFLISNTGSWSTKEYLPQIIIENKKSKKFLMVQVESSISWYFEIGDENGHLYLNVGGPNMTDHNTAIKIGPSPRGYRTKYAAFVVGDSINEVIQEMTKYRRHIVNRNLNDAKLPVIFNEYMHLSWDGPEQSKSEFIAEKLKDYGINYYVMDCGWHDECAVDEIYKECGEWLESSVRFPKGVKKTTSRIRSLGMKSGLWIEPEIIGFNNQNMIEYYGDDAFFKRNGKNIIMSNRMFLDFRNEKVVKYLNATIDRMINQYGANYIKMDYNQDCGYGTEVDAITLGEGLLKHSDSYNWWLDSLFSKYPNVIFEACASGGCRMDYETLSRFSITSTSDQTNYQKYPYIASNILSAVLPEQAGVWSYPVDCINSKNIYDDGVEELIDSKISKEQIAMNMINSFLGRMHLASAIFLLSDEKQNLVKEGIRYYNSITKAKKEGVPYLPFGFSHFGDKHVSSGFISNSVLYLAVWNLNGEKEVVIPIKEHQINNCELKYPSYSKACVNIKEHEIKIIFENSVDSCFLEIGLSK